MNFGFIKKHTLNQFKALGMVLALFSMANAQEINSVKQRFRSYQDKSRELQNIMQAKELLAEFNTLNQWISQADLAQRNDEDDRFIRLVNQIDVQLRFIDVSLENIKAQELILQKGKEAAGLETKAKQTREEVAQLEESLSMNQMPRQVNAQQNQAQQNQAQQNQAQQNQAQQNQAQQNQAQQNQAQQNQAQ